MNFRFSVRMLTLATIGVLAIWLLVWLGLLTHGDIQERILWLALTLSPLMPISYFLWHGHKAGYAWCGFIALGYFAQGVTVTLTSKSDAGYAVVEIFLSLALFSAASAALRSFRQYSG